MQTYDYARYARLALRGEDRVRFLHGMVTCDIEKLALGAGSRAAMLSVKGRLLADLVVYARSDELVLTMGGDLGEKVRGIFDKHIVMDDVEVIDRSQDLAEIGVYGDDAAATIEKFAGVHEADLVAMAPYAQVQTEDGLLIARDPQLGVPGWRVIAKPGAWPRIGNAMTDEQREVLRVEAGTARYGVDLDEERLIMEANLDDAISFDKGCYLGQEVVVRATTRGRVNRKLVGLVVSGEGPVPARSKLSSETQPGAGITTSSVVSPRMGGAIALGYVHRAALEAGAVLTLDGGRHAVVLDLPFAPDAVAAGRKRL